MARWDALAPLTVTHAYTARGLMQGDRFVLTLAGVGTLGQPDSLTLAARERGGRLDAALAPMTPTPWNAWRAAGTLARSDVAYGAGTLSGARSDGLQLTAAAPVSLPDAGSRRHTRSGPPAGCVAAALSNVASHSTSTRGEGSTATKPRVSELRRAPKARA